MARSRDRGVTLVELTVVIAIVGVLSTALLAGIAVILRTNAPVSQSITENRANQQLTNYFYGDVRSTPAVMATTPQGFGVSLTPTERGCTDDDDGSINVLQLTWPWEGEVQRASYRLVADDTTSRLERETCMIAPVFQPLGVSSIAGELRATGSGWSGAAALACITDDKPPATATITDGVVVLTLEQAGQTQSFVAALQTFDPDPEELLTVGCDAPNAPSTTTTSTTTSTSTTTEPSTTTTSTVAPTEPSTSTSTTTTTTTTTSTTTTTTTTTAPVTVPPVVSVNPLDPAAGFSVITSGDATLSGTGSQGAVAVGVTFRFGEWRDIAASAASSLTLPGESQATGLLVGGGVDLASSNSQYKVVKGFAHVGTLGTNVLQVRSGSVHIAPAGTSSDNSWSTPRLVVSTAQGNDAAAVVKPGAFPFGNNFALMRTYASRIAALNPAACAAVAYAQLTEQNGNHTLQLTPGKVNVLTITATQLSSINNVSSNTNVSATTPLIINITDGGAVNIPAKYWPLLQNGDRTAVLWNVPNATSVSVGSTVYGTVYAPNAAVTMSNTQLFGDVVAAALTTSGGSIELAHFATSVPCIG